MSPFALIVPGLPHPLLAPEGNPGWGAIRAAFEQARQKIEASEAEDAAEIAEAERKSALRTILRVVPYLWPRDRFDVRLRVILALVLLVFAKAVINFAPFLYRDAVNALTESGNSPFLLGAVGLTVAYGSARILSRGFEQLRDRRHCL